MNVRHATADADRVRGLLQNAGVSQRSGAREIGIDERTMRRYCAGYPVPKTVLLALEALVTRARQART
jgi:hypothetical protein